MGALLAVEFMTAAGRVFFGVLRAFAPCRSAACQKASQWAWKLRRSAQSNQDLAYRAQRCAQPFRRRIPTNHPFDFGVAGLSLA
jgi:hypothetical protein